MFKYSTCKDICQGHNFWRILNLCEIYQMMAHMHYHHIHTPSIIKYVAKLHKQIPEYEHWNFIFREQTQKYLHLAGGGTCIDDDISCVFGR
jgi:hypothetical protein